MKFDEYYMKYLLLHLNKTNRRLHFVGLLTTFLYIWVCVSHSLWWWLLAAPFIVYPFAWVGHIVFEKNQPAAWSSPLMAKLSDLRMFFEILIGKIKW